MFELYCNGNFSNVKTTNEDVSKIVGTGDLHLEIDTSYKLVLKDIRHVSNLCLSLLSMFFTFGGEKKKSS